MTDIYNPNESISRNLVPSRAPVGTIVEYVPDELTITKMDDNHWVKIDLDDENMGMHSLTMTDDEVMAELEDYWSFNCVS